MEEYDEIAEEYMCTEVDEIDEDLWCYIVRRDTNELLINKSHDPNVCKRYHLKYIMPRLNQHGDTWEAMTIADYNRKFRNVGVV